MCYSCVPKSLSTVVPNGCHLLKSLICFLHCVINGKKKNLTQSLINTSLSEKTPWQPATSLLNHYIHCHNQSGSARGGQQTEISRPLFSRVQPCDSHPSDSWLTLTFPANDTDRELWIFHGFVRVRAISVIELITDSWM